MFFVVDNPNLYCTVVELRKVCILVLTYKEIELLHVKILRLFGGFSTRLSLDHNTNRSYLYVRGKTYY